LVGDDPDGYTEAACYVLHELCFFFQHDFCDRSNFNPLGEFVDGHENVPRSTWDSSEQTYGVKDPHGEGPSWGNCAEDLSWQVLLFGKELASFAPLYEVFSVRHGYGPLEARSVCFADQIGRGRVAATLSAMNLS
jgi:hypothetical protein